MTSMAGADAKTILTDEHVAAMVFEQFPALAGREIGRRYTLPDHVTVRIGDDYGVLFPTIPGQDHLFARASELLAPLLPQWSFPYSAPIATGVPQGDYPYHWNLVHWLSGSTAAFVPLHDESAGSLGAAIREIHRPSPESAPLNPVTSVPLSEQHDEWHRLLAAAEASGAPENRVLNAAKADAMWRRAAEAPLEGLRWTHGTLEPRAVLSDRGAFSGILIWQRFGAGDAAADLGYAANLVSLSQRDRLLTAYGPTSRATAARAEGWQLLGALRLIEVKDPFLVRIAWERLIEFDLVSEG
jgi:aminoglycoside phosphotransferase (APT) family kinase protein